MLTIESLGLSREEILERVVNRAAEMLLEQWVPDGEGGQESRPTKFSRAMEKVIAAKVDTAIHEIAAAHVLPNVAAYIESFTLQETNRWGEKTGKALTFTEYLVKRAEEYIVEDVNYDGKAEHERAGGYSWNKSGTRIAYMINKHLQYSIQTAMESALKTANSKIVGGIEEAVKIKLAEVLASLKVEAKVGR